MASARKTRSFSENTHQLRGSWVLMFGRDDCRLTRPMRLEQHDVVQILGVRHTRTTPRVVVHGTLQGPRGVISIKYLMRECLGVSAAQVVLSPQFRAARVAISAPKRLLKTAVSRNRFKRGVREAFRQHEIRHVPVDMLVSFLSQHDKATGTGGQSLPRLINQTFDLIRERLMVRTQP